MTCIRIKQLGERIAASDLHFGGPRHRRRLEPGEVVDIPEDLKTDQGINLLNCLLNTGIVEIVRDEPTRPLDYVNEREAVLCAPSFKPRGPDEVLEREAALQAVADREAAEATARFIETVKPETPDEVNKAPSTSENSKPARSPARRRSTRATRRAAIGKGDANEPEVSA